MKWALRIWAVLGVLAEVVAFVALRGWETEGDFISGADIFFALATVIAVGWVVGCGAIFIVGVCWAWLAERRRPSQRYPT